MISKAEIEGLSPGVKDAVLFLNKLEFETCDSGDGSNYSNGMECAMPFPNIIIQSTKADLFSESDRLAILFKRKGITNITIEASYDPVDGSALIMLLDHDNSGEFSKLV